MAKDQDTKGVGVTQWGYSTPQLTEIWGVSASGVMGWSPHRNLIWCIFNLKIWPWVRALLWLLKLGATSCTSAFRFELESCYYLKKWYCFCRFCRIGLAPVLIEITASPFTGFYARVCLCVFTYSIQWSYSVWFAGEVWQQMWGRTWDCLCLYSITILCLQGMRLYLDNHIFTKSVANVTENLVWGTNVL